MRVLSWDVFTGSRPLKSSRIAMSIGVFDGVHLGHRSLIEQLIKRKQTEPVILTFRYNPRRFLKPHLFPGDITTQHQKLKILSRLGIGTVILIDFSNDFSKLSGNDFLMQILQNCNLDYVVLGDNFRCGYQGRTSAYDARKMLSNSSVDVHIAQPVSLNGAAISSTRIRAAVREGKIDDAVRMMERSFILDLADIPQDIEVDYRSIEKMGLNQVIPPPGTYPVHIHTPAQTFTASLMIDDECLRWNHRSDEDAVCIEFEDTLTSKGEKNHAC